MNLLHKESDKFIYTAVNIITKIDVPTRQYIVVNESQICYKCDNIVGQRYYTLKEKSTIENQPETSKK